MIKKIALTVAFTWLTAGTSFAAWTLVDDMTYADQAAVDAAWSPYPLDSADGSGGGAQVATDPADANNDVLKIVSGILDANNTTSAYNAFASRSLPSGAEISTLGTVYFRVNVPTVDIGGTLVRAVVDVTWGLSWRKPIADPNAPDPATEVVGGYGDYSVVSRNEFDQSYDVFDLGSPGSYQTVLVDGIDTDIWYEMWYVCDHANNQFKIYAKGPGLGNGTDQTLVYPFDPDAFTPIGWGNERSPSTEPLRSFLIYSSAGTGTAPKGLDYMFVDDIYVDNTGINLTSPINTGSIVNISTRGLVGSGADIMIGGFAIDGSPRTVLLRGVGPELINFGVPTALTDTVITLFDAGGNAIATNDNWGEASNAAQIEAATLAVGGFELTAGGLDSAILITLEPGQYTLQLSAKAGATGSVGLIEAYSTP